MNRRSLSTTARVRIFEEAGGLCHICGQKIFGKGWDVEHVIPLAMGGEDGGDNLRPAHKACHSEKSRDDFGRIAKAKRQRAAHIGARKRGSFPKPPPNSRFDWKLGRRVFNQGD